MIPLTCGDTKILSNIKMSQILWPTLVLEDQNNSWGATYLNSFK